jgi:N-acetylmuramoyl-L-alanine amidase
MISVFHVSKLYQKRVLIAGVAWLFIFLLAGTTGVSNAATPRDLFFAAENSERFLRNSPRKMKYRENWFKCIRKYQAVYSADPHGPWAAAGLYHTGVLYADLYKRSFKASDKLEALDIFKRIVKRFPHSRYKARSLSALADFSKKKVVPKKTNPKKVARINAKEKYMRAERAYRGLRGQPKKMKHRDNWLACIAKFKSVYVHDPNGPWASASLYMAGKLYGELYGLSYRKADKQQALAEFNHIISSYPASSYYTKALAAKKSMGQGAVKPRHTENKHTDAIDKIIQNATAKTAVAKHNTHASGNGYAKVTGIRYWSNPNYTRIVVDADQEMAFTNRLLKQDPSIKKPQRLYVDLNRSRLGDGLNKELPINDHLLISARAGQYKPDAVMVVVDIKSFKTYKIFSLKNPFRIVIDVWGMDENGAYAQKGNGLKKKNGNKIASSALARQLALGVRRVIIDPGHGGRDYGAPGYYKGVHEKNIVLEIAKKLAVKMRSQLHCEVIMTRTTDKYLTLEERTAIANTKNADLFISIHTNSVRDRRAYGIETYFLNLATDDDAILVAARENATSTKNISDLESILNDLMQNAKINESSRLAGYVQNSLCGTLKKKYSNVKNKGVKQAPFYVLLGAQMPAILIETSFISNARECKRLRSAAYQDRLCDAIIKGVSVYIKETNPTAWLQNQKKSGNRG